jgi:endoglucanase
MRLRHPRRPLRRHLRRVAAATSVAAVVAGSLIAVETPAAAAVPLSIAIKGNHFVNGAGHVVRLLGVNHTSAEYGCVDGFGYDDGHFTDADAAAIASWKATAVRVPLNEDCWLGINGQPNSSQGADPPLTRDGYRHRIAAYVAALNRHGLYAILDLHWSAPGGQVALEQQPMPDFDHSPAFWTSVASTFKNNHAVVFDLYNEPYDPTDPRSGDDQNASDKVTWNCWETGTKAGPAGGDNCFTAAYDENGHKKATYRVAGLQTLLDAVRAAGAKQPIMTGGLDYANDLGDADHGGAWMNHAPDDPLNQEAASFHDYMDKACDHLSCWNGTLAPIAAHVPVVTDEFDEDNYLQRKCNAPRSTFDARYMAWADSKGVSYLAWGWIVESQAEKDADGCSAFYLIENYSHYTPAAPNGVALRDHLRALFAPPVRLTSFHASAKAGNRAVRFTLRTASTSRGTLTGRTIHRYAVSGKRRHVALGSGVRFTLKAHLSRVVLMGLSRRAHRLLVRKGKLAVLFTIVLTSPGHRRTVVHHSITLRAR